MNRKVNIRWAFDPYHEDKDTWARLKELLLILSQKLDCQITPTYVVGDDLTNWIGHARPGSREKLLPRVHQVMEIKLKEYFSELTLNKPDIFVSEGYSKRSDSQRFVQRINNLETDMLVVSSHAYRGVKRFFLGSFAEGLVTRSGLPTYVVSPHTSSILSQDKACLPTDLSEKSFGVFSELLHSKFWCAKKLFLYHRVHQPSMALLQTSSYALDGGQMALEEYFGNLRKDQEAKIKAWNQAAADLSIDVTTLVEDNSQDLADIVLLKAKTEQCDFIVMPSFAGAFEAALVGSLAKEVLRRSSLPVLVWHKG